MLLPSTYSLSSRRGVVLLAVLIVIVVLSLAAYRYNEYTMGEYRAVDSSIRAAQARAFAESGIWYSAGMLVDPTNSLGGNPWNNQPLFQGISVPSTAQNAKPGRFTVLGLMSPDDLATNGGGSQAYRFGVTDESGKINLNALLALDNGKGNIGSQILLAIPNMTANASDSILDWMDPDDTPRTNGAENSYYQALSPPYQCKNGPFDSVEELLLVANVTPQLLYGNDRNRNAVLDPGEDDGTGSVDLGWSAYLTVYSREANVDSTNNGRVYINDGSLSTLTQNLATAGLTQDVITYIAGYRLYGSNSSGGGGGGAGGGAGAMAGAGGGGGMAGGGMAGAGGAARAGGAGGGAMGGVGGIGGAGLGGGGMGGAGMGGGRGGATGGGGGGMGRGGGGGGGASSGNVQAAIAQIQTAMSNSSVRLNNLTTLWDLVTGTVSVPVNVGGRSTNVTVPNPFSDQSQQEQLLPTLFDKCSTSQSPDLSPRINVNTATQAVLTALQAAVPSLQSTDVQNIINTRPPLSDGTAPDPIFSTPTWLLTRANVSASTLQKLDKYITTRTQIYRLQSIGYFDDEGPVSRLEAVVDTNQGRPRIVYLRDLTDLGRGFDMKAIKGSQ